MLLTSFTCRMHEDTLRAEAHTQCATLSGCLWNAVVVMQDVNVPIAEATPGANKFAVDTASTLQCTFGPGLPNNRLVIRKTPIAIIVSQTVTFAQQHCQYCLQLYAVLLRTQLPTPLLGCQPHSPSTASPAGSTMTGA
jgi:hypothetical protein